MPAARADDPGRKPRGNCHHTKRRTLRYRADHPWTHLLLQGIGRLQTLPAP